MPNNQLSKYSVKIKDVYIELKNYKFFHSPYEDKGKHRFIGRDKVKNRIVSILDKTEIKSGSYLITGFRGMGKTSIIREAIEIYNKKVQENLEAEDKRNLWITNALTTVPNLRFIKRFLVYTLVLFGVCFLTYQNGYETDSMVIPPYFDYEITLIVIFFILHLFFLQFDYTRDKDSRFTNKKLARFSNYKELAITMYAVITLLILGLAYWTFRSSFTNLLIPFVFYFLLLISNFLLLGFSDRISKAVWDFFNLVFVVSLFLISILFFYDYKPFVEIDQLESFYKIYDLPSYVRIIIGLIFSYTVLTVIFFIADILGQILISIGITRNKKVRSKFKTKYEKFEINLSLESLNEMDVLRRITIQLEEFWLDNRSQFSRPFFERKIYFLWRFILSRIRFSKSDDNTTPGYNTVLRKLTVLRNRMSGEVTSRKEIKFKPKVSTGIINGLARIAMPLGMYSNKDEINYPIANSKEAEDQLKSIFEDIDKIRRKNELNIPQFIFIIDELDKIEPHSNSNIQDREVADPILVKNIKTGDANHYRRRQEAVSQLLANLKGFLNVVRAKFFFIGGREMYDAALADISDRDSFYSSIFNDVIYVNSFFKDSNKKSKGGRGGVTQMTEEYLCNIILDEKCNNLRSLYEKTNFFKCEQGTINEVSLAIADIDKTKYGQKILLSYDELKEHAYKTIFLLQNYVVYLTYRSNGTPKKLTALTEKLIVEGPEIRKNEDFLANNIVILHREGNSIKQDLSKKLFLKFGFNIQYEIGLTANLYRPYLIANSRHLKTLGDKLLFSSSFIIDHILKFHPFGFSWRNLELIPEVVLVNREPNLRKFIEELMRFYSKTYIKDTVSGIFDYTFRSIVKRELIYLSKTSDLSSAAFNFTLDESLSIKRHYKRKLSELQELYKTFKPIERDNQFIHSLCFIQTILGDLHFYDKEYDEAVVYYTESIQALRLPDAVSKRYLTRHQFLLWLRNQLKLGLSLEKIRAFEFAFSLYKTLMLDTERYLKIVVSQDSLSSSPKLISSTEYQYSHSKRMTESEDHRTIQLLSMPFVSFLAVIEKARMDGITLTNLVRNQEEFTRTVDPDTNRLDQKCFDKIDFYRRNFLKADYYNNVGSILYYKNYQFSCFFDKRSHYMQSFEEDCNDTIAKQFSEQYSKSREREYDYFPSLTPLTYYWNALYFLIVEHRNKILHRVLEHSDKKLQLPNYNLLALSTALLLPKCVDYVSSRRLYYIANMISKIGDSILASLKESNFKIPNERFLFLDITAPEEHTDKRHFQNIEKFHELLQSNMFSVDTVLYAYKLAAALYKRSGNNASYASHLIKMLYVVKDVIEANKNIDEVKAKLSTFLDINFSEQTYSNIEQVAVAVFKATTWNNEVSNRPQILKYREILGLVKNKYTDLDLLYNNINNTTDNREILILVESLKMKLGGINTFRYLEGFNLSKSIISTYGSVNNRYLRMLELKYRSERCYFILKHVFKAQGLMNTSLDITFSTNYEEIHDKLKLLLKEVSNLTFVETIIFLIKESLFCLRELIKMFKLYDPGYVIGYSFIAEAHNRMGDWCLAYENLNVILSHDFEDTNIDTLRNEMDASGILNEFKKDIKKMLGSDSLAYLESKTHYESAIQYYYKVIQLHSGGKTYKEKIHEVYMLEDDYNDMAAHYTIAAERMRVNTGIIKKKIARLNTKLSHSKLYDYSSYLSSNSKNEQRRPPTNTIAFLNLFKQIHAAT